MIFHYRSDLPDSRKQPLQSRSRPTVLFQASVILSTLLLISHGSWAGEVPFANPGIEVTGSFDRSRFVTGTDMDLDGDIDMVAAAPSSQHEVAWFENTIGDASAWTKRSVDAALLNAVCAMPADIDGDGDVDLVAANLGDGTAGSSKITFYENLAGATSWNPITVVDDEDFYVDAGMTNHQVVKGAAAVAPADVDLDGDLDLFIGSMSNDNTFWLENTAGDGSAWTVHPVDLLFNGTRTITALDFDKDGDLDMVAAGEFEDEVAWFENPGPSMLLTATSWTRHVVSTPGGDPGALDGAIGACPADLDGDGDYDLAAVADGTVDQVVWFDNSGDNLTFTETQIEAGFDSAHGIYCADMDMDGDIDIFAAARSEEPSPFGAIAWWENRLDGGLTWARHDVDEGFGGARSVWFGDVGGDGLGDAVGTGDNDKIEIYSNLSVHRNASFSEVAVDAAFAGAKDAATVDLDRDHDGDVVATGGSAVSWWAQGADGSFTETAISTTFAGAAGVVVGDIDADGDVDVIAAAQTDGDVAWFDNTAGDGSTWTERSIDAAFTDAVDVAVGDIDGDGTLDVVASGFSADTFAWWANTAGDGLSWTETTIGSSHNGALSVQLVDLDRDGDLDLLAGAETDDDVIFFRNSSNGATWTPVLVADGTADGINTVAAGDIDGDGDLDVVGVNEIADTVVWWANSDLSGTGSTWSAAQTIDAFHNGAQGLVLADFDGDGDLDVAAGQSKDGGKVTWYENTGSFGAAWTERNLTTVFDGAAGLAVGDLDFNGQPDVVAAATTAGDVSWFPNRGGQFGLATTNSSPVSLANSTTDDMLKIVATHNGHVGERDLELTSFELLFEETAGDPLTSAEANSILENVFIYVDGDSSGAWEMANDTLVATVGTLALTDGVESVAFVDEDVNVQLTQGTPRTYFVVVETTSTFDSAGLTFFRVTHVTEASSSAEDRTYDTPLLLEWAENVASNDIDVNSGGSTTADLVLTSITDSPDPVDVSGQVTYTVTVTNNGPWPALNVKVASTLPANTSLDSTSGCAEDPSGSPTCTLGSIGAGASDSFTITLDINPAAVGTQLTYTATVSSDTTEAAPGDESDSETTDVIGEGDLVVTTLAVPVEYVADYNLAFHIEVTNNGPNASMDATLSNTLPASLTGKGWSCTVLGGGASCGSAGGSGDISAATMSLPSGATVLFYAWGEVPLGTSTTLTNTATASSSNDSATGNNTVVTNTSLGNAVFADGFETGNTTRWQ